MQRALRVTALVAAIALAGCGSSGSAFNVDTFGSCISDQGGTKIQTHQVQSLESQPLLAYELGSDVFLGKGGLGVPTEVFVFGDEEGAAAADENVKSSSSELGSDHSGPVNWVYPDLEGKGLPEKTESAIRSCIEQAS